MPVTSRFLTRLLLCAATLSSSMLATTAHAEISGAGATFPSLVYARWAQAYEKSAGGQAVVYKPTGSGDGLKQISARSVKFGASDSPLPAAELAKRHLLQIPMLVGGVVPIVNLPGVPDGRVQLTGDLMADIWAGRIRVWNDVRLIAMNPGLNLPALPIRRVVRNEKSGTTEGLTRYLSAVSGVFAGEVGVNQLPNWPGEVLRAEGNDGMVKAVKATAGAIGYVSFDRVQQARLNAVRLRNASGEWVSASETGFRAAIAASDLARQGDDLAPLIDRQGSESWPITLTSFVLIDATPAKGDEASPVMRFLYWCFMHGDELTKGTGFAPLPLRLQSKLTVRFSVVRAQDGKVPDYQAF